MRVGFVGLGKLGLPVATAMAARGLDVWGHDPQVGDIPEDVSHEEGWAEAIGEALQQNTFRFASLKQVVENTDGVIFVAVQTPHMRQFEGVTPLPDERSDFDYSYLIRAIEDIVEEAGRKQLTIAVVSTVLPGTMRRYILPGLPSNISLVYNPSFIAMGTTIPDFLDPEFVLIGSDGNDEKVADVYTEVLDFPHTEAILVHTSIESAELIKVAYNTFIGLKIAFANTLMEVCHKTPGTDVDEVRDALALANKRLISPAYMRGGMGDGGACHPRDNIALSWLARELDLSYDIFGAAMKAREQQARWLLALMVEHAIAKDLPYGILGMAYKPGSSIATGSAARLVSTWLPEVCMVDPNVPGYGCELDDTPRVWLVGCKHPEFPSWEFPDGSVVIDPFRYMPDQEGVEVIRVGQHPPSDNGAARDGKALRALAA